MSFTASSDGVGVLDIVPSDQVVSPGENVSLMCSLRDNFANLGVIQWGYLLFNETRTVPSTVNPTQPGTIAL